MTKRETALWNEAYAAGYRNALTRAMEIAENPERNGNSISSQIHTARTQHDQAEWSKKPCR